MSLKTYNIDVPITPGVMPPVIHIGQYDSGREYIAHLKNDDGTDYTIPANSTATFTGCNPRKEVFEIECNITNNAVIFVPQDEATSMWGKYGATINITSGGEKMSPIVLLMDVQKAGATDEEIAGAANFPDAVTEAVNDWLEDNIEEGQLGTLFVPQAPQAAKTSEMTQPVGMDDNGKLWTTPGGGSGAVTPTAIVAATGQMDAAEKTLTRANLAAAPSTNITKSALSSAVQTSLGKADTAVQPADLAAYVPRGQQANKTNGQTQAVGMDENGKLWVEPPGEGGAAGLVGATNNTTPAQVHAAISVGTPASITHVDGANQYLFTAWREYNFGEAVPTITGFSIAGNWTLALISGGINSESWAFETVSLYGKSSGGTQRIWQFDSAAAIDAWNADPANADNQVQTGDYVYMPYTSGLETTLKLYRVTGDPSNPYEMVLDGNEDFIVNVYDTGLGPTTSATIAQVQAAYAEKREIRMLTEDNILLTPDKAEWGIANGRPTPTRLYFSAQTVTVNGPLLKSYIFDSNGLRYHESDVGKLLGIKRLFVTGTEGQGGVITYALDNPASDFGYGETIDYNRMVGMAIDGADIRMAVKTGLSDWMEYHLVQGGLGGTPPSLLFLGAQTDGNVIRLQMFMLTAMNDVYEVNAFAGPYIPKPQAAHVGYTLIANGQGGFSLTLPEAAAGADGLSPQIKNALLQFAAAAVVNVEDTAESQVIYQNLYDALYPQTEPAELVSISAVYTQGGATVYDNASLDSLKASLVVTAHYDDNTTETVQGYTLTGTLTAGTSTVTVTYEGLTTTFSVAVTQHDPLDEIAYGNLTYREMFIQNNLAFLNDFEGNISLSETPVTFAEDSTYKINAGTPVLSTEQYNTPTHSLKAFGATSQQVSVNIEKAISPGDYLVAISAKCVRWSAGNLGIQVAWNTTSAYRRAVALSAVNNQFDALADVVTVEDNDGVYLRMYVGSFTSADLDGYVDDVVVTPVPSGMTAAQALAAYSQYLNIVKGVQ